VFNAITANMTAINFDDQVSGPNGYNAKFDSTGFVISNTQFLGIRDPANYDYFTGVGWGVNNQRDWGTHAVLEGPQYVEGDTTRRLHIELPTGGNTAISLNLMTWILQGGIYNSGGNYTITLSTGDVIGPAATAAWVSTMANSPANAGIAPTWLGIASDTPITWMDIRSSQGMIVVDNFSFGTAAQIAGGGPTVPDGEAPEATTLIMIGSGLAAMRLIRKRASARAHAAAA